MTSDWPTMTSDVSPVTPDLAFYAAFLAMVRSELRNGFAVYELLPGEARLVRLADSMHWRGWTAFFRLSLWSMLAHLSSGGRYRRVVVDTDGRPRVEYADERW